MQYRDPVNYDLKPRDLDKNDYPAFLNKLTDVPSSKALRPYSIDKAGISEQYAYVKMRALFENDVYVPVLCNINMQVELKGHRGIHMSRCEEALFSLIQEDHDSLDAFSEKLARKIQKLQDSEAAYVSIEATYIHQRKTIKSQLTSYDRMTLFSDTVVTARTVSKRIGIGAFNMTGCPCTETYTKFAVVPKLLDAGFDLEQIKTILAITNSGTHTQRGLATIKVDKPNPNVTYEALYKALEESCHLVYELLKRPDEHELVVRVLRKPQFTEDVVRDIVDQCIKGLGKHLDNDSRITASSRLFDSIHIHDVCTEIDKSYAELVQES